MTQSQLSSDVVEAQRPPATMRQYRLGAADERRLTALLRRIQAAAPTNVGYPVTVYEDDEEDFSAAAPLLDHLLNNVGDPDVDPVYPAHSKDFEREVVAFMAELFRAPTQSFGYVTSGGSESNLYGLYLARSRHPDGLVFHSRASHYSVPKAAHLLGMTTEVVGTSRNGEIDYDELRNLAGFHRNRPAVVVANVGTTMTEAVDDVSRIHQVLDQAGVQHRYVHSDAALSGIPLALTSNRPGFDFADGADSIAVSGHKFLGTRLPCGVVLARRQDTNQLGQLIAYTGSPDTTITGSRSGFAVLLLWLVIRRYGRRGLHERAERARRLAEYTVERLEQIGWPCWRNPSAMTVMLRTPPPHLAAKWALATAEGWSHVMCMPGRTRSQIDALVDDLAAIPEPASPASKNQRPSAFAARTRAST